MGGRAFCGSVLAGVVLNARAGFRWLHDWAFAGLLRARNPPAGTSKGMFETRTVQPFSHHADWQPVELTIHRLCIG